MTETAIRHFHDLFDRCMKRPKRFFDVFYDDFLKSSPEVAAKFQHTDFLQQKRALRLSLLLIVEAVVHKTNNFSALEATALRHSRQGVNIPPHLYTLWLDSLVRAVAVCDDEFTAETEAVWRAAFQPAIDFLVSKY